MTDIIKTKLEELAKQKEQAIANLNAILGAEQALNDILKLSEVEKSENE